MTEFRFDPFGEVSTSTSCEGGETRVTGSRWIGVRRRCDDCWYESLTETPATHVFEVQGRPRVFMCALHAKDNDPDRTFPLPGVRD